MTVVIAAQRGDKQRSVTSRRLADVARSISTPVVVLIDLWVGLAWLLLPSSYWAAPFYDPARTVMSWLPHGWEFRAWGIVMIALAVGWFLRRPNHPRPARFCLSGLVIVWCFWFGIVSVGWLTSKTGGLLPPLAFLAVRAHWPGTTRRRAACTPPPSS